MTKLKRVFIANRGEICGRIATTAKRLGIETVAITDREHPPSFLLPLIDHFITIEDETTAVYLNGTQIIQFAKDSGCDCIHPGFGFLSENEAFARQVEEAGLIWIGPTHQSISMLASKATARDLAIESKIPCVNGLQNFHVPKDESGDFSELEQFAEKTGYPLIIKAALGGGGKGMRLVHQKSELKDAALRARSEAINSFGDDALIVERYVESPRHIEVQIIADSHGNVAAIGDRDCSVQRRHQKILEEAPAPALTEETRNALHSCAINLAKRVGYRSAGTVEFLLDWSKKGKQDKQEFFFLEMNTRLQVEHPVSEEVYGIDLVEWQFRIAESESLPKHFQDLTPSRHSIEARFYAEDVDGNFFPSPGQVCNFTPHHDIGIRWEMGLDTIDEITPKFDPMVAKVIATGATREVALQKLASALKNTVFAGPVNNLEFLMDICTHSPYAEGPVDTHFIEHHFEDLISYRNQQRDSLQESANEILAQLIKTKGNLLHSAPTSTGTNIKETTLRAFSPSYKPKNSNPNQKLTVSKVNHSVSAAFPSINSSSGVGVLFNDGHRQHFHYASIKTPQDKQYWVFLEGRAFSHFETPSKWEGSESAGTSESDISAPVPGKVIKTFVKAGDSVTKDQVVFVLESMKMEFEVKAPKDGVIESVGAKEGDQVTTGQQLAHWEE